MSHTLAYTGAILDGEGCFTITKHLKEKKYLFYQVHINVTNASRKLIDFLHAHFGGSIGIMRNVYYTWNLRDVRKLRGFLIDVIPYLLIKRRQAELLLKFVQSRLVNKGRSYAEQEIHFYEEVRRLKKEYPDDLCNNKMSQEDKRHYLAGLIDGEGSVRIVKAIHKNEYGNEKLILTPQISIANTDKRLMEFLKKEFGGFIVEKRREGKWRTLYQWYMQGLKEEFFRQLDGKLIIKQEQLSVILDYISSRKTHYTREAEVDLFLKINKLNKKGKIKYSSEDLTNYTALLKMSLG